LTIAGVRALFERVFYSLQVRRLTPLGRTPDMLVTQAYRFALDPTPQQARAMASHCGAARFAFNWGLSLVKQRLDERAASPLASITVPWTLSALRLEWNRTKDNVAPWWAENSKEADSQPGPFGCCLTAIMCSFHGWA
jgi:hypothetical protein